MNMPMGLRAAVVSVVLFVAFVLAWHLGTRGEVAKRMPPMFAAPADRRPSR